MFARFAVRHPVTVAVLCVAASLLGLLAARNLPVDLLPELSAPRIAVLVSSGDRPPEELEDAYARPVETALATLSGVTSVRTKTTVGRVLATVEYAWDTNMDLALLDVQKQVAPLATDRDVDSLVVRRYDPAADPILVLALADESKARVGEETARLDELRRLAEERIARTLERVPGVADVQVAGGRKREVRVTFEPEQLAAFGLSAERLSSLLSAANAEASGGTVEDRGRVHVIKGIGKFERLEDVADLPIPGTKRPGDTASAGAPLLLREVAEVGWEDAPVRGLVTVGRKDGEPVEGMSLAIFKEPGENTVAVSDRVHEALKSLGNDLRGLDVTVVRDQADFIRESISQVKSAAVVGSLLAILVLAFFLRNVAAIVLIAIAIPLSLVATFGLMAAGGLTFNLVTLGGLALSSGMLVDNAIVILEAILRRIEEGEEPEAAAIAGTQEVGGAIFASTLTTIVVFLPVLFVKGLASQMFMGLAMTVTWSQLTSLVIALLVVPTVAARLYTKEGAIAARSWRETSPSKRYEGLLRSVLDHKGTVLGVVALLVVIAGLLAARLPREFMPASDGGEITARLLLPAGSRVGVTAEAAARLESAVRGAWPDVVEASVAELGDAVREEGTLSEDVPSENRGVLRLRFVPRKQRTVTMPQVGTLLDEAASQIEGLSLSLDPDDAVLGRMLRQGAPIRVELLGADDSPLESVTGDVRNALAALPQLFDVHSSFEDRRAEVRLVLDRVVAAGLQLSPESVARQLSRQLGTDRVTSFRERGEERDVVLRTQEQTLATLPGIELDSPNGGRVRLGDIARLEVESSPTAIERTLGSRLGAVTAQVAPGASLGSASQAVDEAMSALQLPGGVRAQVAGAERERRESFRELGFAVLLAILLVYMVMASLFESLVHPFTILFTLPTALVGVVAGLSLAGTGWSVPSLLGTVMLAGIAVNNGILLVDVTGMLREQGMTRREALIAAGRMRLRPILMTSLTAILGMLPLAVGIGEGAGLRAPMAIAVAGGLFTSTFLTLVLIPVVYDLVDRIRPGQAA